MDLLAIKLLQFLFQGGELELEEPRSKYERYKDASGRWVTSRSGDARPVKIGYIFLCFVIFSLVDKILQNCYLFVFICLLT